MGVSFNFANGRNQYNLSLLSMRILMITPYVTIEGRSEFEKNKTGFGYMVLDIAKAVGKMEEVDLLATDSRGRGFVEERVRYLKRSIALFLRHLHRCLPIASFVGLVKRYPQMQRPTKIRLFYYWLMTGYMKRIIRTGHYDIVHMHGCSLSTDLWMEVCDSLKQKFVVTLHGLNSFSDTVKLEPAGKQYERDFLKRVMDGEIPITVISTGMKRLIEKTYGVKDRKNITVVSNAFNFADDLRGGRFLVERLEFGDDSHVILCVGNVSRKKNQGQLIRAFELLPEGLAERTYIVFLGGNYEKDYTIEKLSEGCRWASHFIACGAVPKEAVAGYYEQCDAVALMSLSEGFGLSLIEGMHFGRPSMSFTDVDAFEDIYNECAMIGVGEHSDEAVAKGLEILLTKEWDSERIKKYSKKFETERMANNYIYVYKKEIQHT